MYFNYGEFQKIVPTRKPLSKICYSAPTTKKIVTKPPCTTRPPTTCGPAITSCRPVTTCGIATVQKPVVTTQKVVVTTKKPVVTTKKPVVTTKKPVVTTTKKVVVTTKKPVVTTKKPVITTTKKVVVTTTKKPICPATYVVRKGDTMLKIANAHGTDLVMLKRLNPNIKNMNIIYPNQKICMPKPVACIAKYTVKSGDTTNKIAQMFGTNLKTLQKMNPNVTNINFIYPGQILCVPKMVTTTKKSSCPVTYTIKSGDTMFNIANSFGTDLAMLKRLNPNMKNMDLIYPNQKVCVPQPIACAAKYTVKSGDTMNKIAQMFGTDLKTLQKMNPYITDINLIYPGQKLCVPKIISTTITTTTTTTKTPTQGSCDSVYVVKSGDTMFNIANAHGTDLAMLKKLNPDIKNMDLIYPDQKVCVPKPLTCKKYTVKSGDTMWNIAKAHGTDLATLQKLNPYISNIDLIYPDQQLCVP